MVSDMQEQSKYRVLIADDDPTFLELARYTLTTAGFETIGVRDGAAAMMTLHDVPVDLAIVDLSMPRIDGFRLIALIRATPHLRRLPILVITSRTDPSAIEEGYRVGANDYITKPVIWGQLPSRVSYLIEHGARLPVASNHLTTQSFGAVAQ
ncbi:MAG: PleD family two-component response regulator [Hyphomicrobiaceae bacterium]|jgi:PleD family two-component response regulator